MGVDGEEIDVDSRGNAKTPKNKKLKGGPKHFSIGLWWEFAIQTARRILQNKINFMLGFCACFIVVIVVALLITMIGQSPLVLLRLAELSEGEIDFLLQPNDETTRLNYTLALSSMTEQNSQFQWMSPRYVLDVETYSPDPVFCPYNMTDKHWKWVGVNGTNEIPEDCALNGARACFDVYCLTPAITGKLFVIDSEKELEMAIGRNWKLGALPKNSVYMSTNVGRSLGLNEGDSFHLYLNAFVAFDQMWSQALGPIDENVTIVYPSGHIFLVLKVEKFFDDVNGKYDNSESHGIIMEWKYFWETIYENTSPITPQDRIQRLPSVNLDHYAQQIVASFGPERTEYYLDQNYDTIQQNIVNYASQFIYSVGFSQVSVSLPVLGGVYSTRFLGLFLGLILNIVIFVLLFLSVLLIYSLLMINVETRIFEMGVMRILGTGRIGIILLLLFQAFFYAIPAWAIGLAGAAGVMYGVVEGFESLTGVSIDPVLSWESILTATALGILIPILSAIFPIRTALGKNLFESLDVRHSKTKAVEISLHRSEAGSFSWLWIITGTFFAGFGFGVYYVFPLSLLSFNLALLLNLFFFLLLGMILGLVVLSLNLENILQKLLIWIFFFWESTFVRLLVTKNLVAHRIRNRKTSIVYALSLGFIIFVQVAYVVTATSFEYGIQRNAGAFMAVWGGNVANGDDIQNVEELENYCSSVPSVIESFTWQSYYLTDFLSLSGCIITNIGHAYTANQFVSAVSPNYFTSSLNDYLIVDSQVENNRTLWPSELLYTVEGSKSIILGTLYSTDSSLNLNITSHAILQLTEDTYPIQTVTRRRLKPSSFLSSCPGMSMSQFTSVASQDAIVSIPSYVRLAGLKSVDQIPLWSFLIKFTDDVTDTDKDDVITQLESITRSQSNIQVWDYRTQLKPITQTNSLVNIFFSGVTAITMIIAFFSLMASMYSNIFEQTKEIAIIRAVGVSRFAVFRIYLWEAFIVVFGSSLLGIVIGAFIGWTMTLQRVLFTQLPITVTFPWTILGIVAGTSVVVSLLATCSPVWRVVRQQTVQIMRYIG